MNFAFCRVAISPIRAEQKDSSEIVSQLVFGELIKVKSKQENWIKIETLLDCYEGFIDEKQIHHLSDKDAKIWLVNQQIITKNTTINTPIGRIEIPKGSFLHKETPEFFRIGEFDIRSNYKKTTFKLISFAKSFLNTSYLWGGKTNYGIDCSGFTQLVFRNEGIELPRDASQQIHHGKSIDFKTIKTGDVVFFSNVNGKIIHVGIMISKSKIIHASGRVKIDTLDSTGIWSEELQKHSHSLHSIKRMI